MKKKLIGFGILLFIASIFIISRGVAFNGEETKTGSKNNNTQIIDGSCVVESYIAEGEVGEDKTKRKRFHCDNAIITFLDDEKKQAMVTFVDKKLNRNNLIAFAGKTDSAEGIKHGESLKLEKIYLKPGVATLTSSGQCNDFWCLAHLDDSNNPNINTDISITFIAGLHDDSSEAIEYKTMADYSDAKDAHDAFDKCLVQSVKRDDNWFTMQDKCGGFIDAWCTEQGFPTDQQASLMPAFGGKIDMRCDDSTQREKTSIVMQYGNQRQKVEWKAAGGDKPLGKEAGGDTKQ